MSLQRDSAATVARTPLDGQPFRMAALTMPADKDYLALARLATMHVAGLLGLPIGHLTDLRLAVNEACALLLNAPAGHGGTGVGALELSFERCPGHLCVTVRGPAPASRPDTEDIGWLVLRALVNEVSMEISGATATLTLIETLPAR